MKELAALEDVDEERRALAQALKHGEDEEKQLRDEQLKNVVVERDLLKLALDDKITELKMSELATDQARNALTASEDQRRHDSATKASAIDALGAAKRLEQVEEEKKKAVAELVAMRSRLEGVQQERDEAMATRTQVESTLATKMRVFRSKWEQATTEHAAEVDKLKQQLAAASAISSSASPPSLSSTLKCRHQGCHPTPPFILERSQSPLVNAAEKAYGEAGVLPSEISSSKDPRWYAQPDLPAKRVAKVRFPPPPLFPHTDAHLPPPSLSSSKPNAPSSPPASTPSLDTSTPQNSGRSTWSTRTSLRRGRSTNSSARLSICTDCCRSCWRVRWRGSRGREGVRFFPPLLLL